MNIDDLLFLIGRLTVEKELLLRVNSELQAQINALTEKSQPESAEKER